MPGLSVYRHLAVWREGDVTIVRFGDHRILDTLTVSKLGDELSAVADREDCRKLLLNFAGVEALNSLMLGKLMMLRRKLVSKGGKLALCEVTGRTQEDIKTTRLDTIIDLYDSEVDAVHALQAKPEAEAQEG